MKFCFYSDSGTLLLETVLPAEKLNYDFLFLVVLNEQVVEEELASFTLVVQDKNILSYMWMS